jgi:hypothetical protein
MLPPLAHNFYSDARHGVVVSCLVNMARKKMKNQNKIMKLTDKKKNNLLKKNVLIQLSHEDFFI